MNAPQQAPQQAGQFNVVDIRVGTPLPAIHLGLQPPGKEYWKALLAAQAKVKDLFEDGAVPDKKGEVQYTYASARTFLKESKKVLGEFGLGFVQVVRLADPDATGRRTAVHASYLVYHAETASGLLFPFEYVVHATEYFPPQKAVGAAITMSIRYFLRGFLNIVTVDEEPAVGPDGQQPSVAHDYNDFDRQQAAAYHQHQAQHAQQGHAGYAQGQWPQQQHQGYPAQHSYGGTVYPRPEHQQQQRPIMQEPVVQQAAQMFGASAVAGNGYQQHQGWQQQPQHAQGHQGWQQQQQQRPPQAPQQPPPQAPQQPPPAQQQPQAPPPPPAAPSAQGRPDTDVRQGEPQSADEWHALLVEIGWPDEVAADLVDYPPMEQVSETMRDELLQRASEYFTGNKAAMLEAWGDTGFTPNPNALNPDGTRVRPTGKQSLRYARKLDWSKKQAVGAGQAQGGNVIPFPGR